MSIFSLLIASAGASAAPEVGWFALPVSVVAALIAGVALWRTQFSRGRLIFALGMGSVSVTEWKSKNGRWITPDLAVAISIANTGAQAAVIQELRLKARFPELPIPNAHEIWSFNSELDLETELAQGQGRTTIAAMRGNGPPFIVLPKANVDKRFVFWTRWEKPVMQTIIFDLEVRTSLQPKWKVIGGWEFSFTPDGWVYLAREGGRFAVSAVTDKPGSPIEERVPADLHKYTGTEATLPADSGFRDPSYVVTNPE
jgi:hypothetical protein